MPIHLQVELKQQKPFGTAEQEAALSLARTAAVLEHAASEVFKPRGLTPTQYNALRILQGAGPEGLCRNEIRDRLIARVPDASRLLDRLEAMGHLTRSREGVDRRMVRARITPSGSGLLQDLEAEVVRLHQRQLGHLGAKRLALLIELLAEARAGSDSGPSQGESHAR